MRLGQGGFSLLELLVSISITAILLLVGGNFVVDGTLSANVDYNRTVVQSNTKTAVDIVARTIRSARSVEAQNAQPDPNPPVTGNPYSWSGTAGVDATLILAIPARDAAGNLLYIDGLHNNLYTNDVIFYLDPSTRRLYKRTIANAVAGNAAKTTCPPSLATPTCAPDAVVVEDIASLTTGYLDDTNVAVTIPSGTEAVSYKVKESRVIGSRTYSSSYSTITALRNK